MKQLSLEEQELSESVEAGEWQSIPQVQEAIKQAREYAKATFTPVEDVHIQLYQNDLNAIRIKALHEGIPYQTLISNIIHKYLSGRLVET